MIGAVFFVLTVSIIVGLMFGLTGGIVSGLSIMAAFYAARQVMRDD